MYKGYSGPDPGSKEMAAAVQRITDNALRDGTHSRIGHHLCHACRQWVDSIYYIVPLTRVHLCPECADKSGQGPRADEARMRPRS